MSLRWGICGAGKISHDFVVALKTRSEHRVVAVSARSVDSSAKFATTHNIERFYGTYEELAKDKEVRVTYTCILPCQVRTRRKGPIHLWCN